MRIKLWFVIICTQKISYLKPCVWKTKVENNVESFGSIKVSTT